MSWVAQQCWQYDLSLNPADMPELSSDLASSEPLYLRFAGLDTLATVFVNGRRIAQTSNAFRTHYVALDASVLATSAGQPATNTLTVRLDSVIPEAKRRAAVYPYAVPATENWNVWVEPSSRNFVRKAGSDFGSLVFFVAVCWWCYCCC